MAVEWEYIVQEEIQANRFIPLPADIKATIELDHPLHGPSVCWNIQRGTNIIVLSQRSLENDDYVSVGRYKLYTETEDRTRIRPPADLDDVVESAFLPGNRVVFLAHTDMIDNGNGMVYLLTVPQVLELLPGALQPNERAAIADGNPSGLRDAVLRMPGFLPVP